MARSYNQTRDNKAKTGLGTSFEIEYSIPNLIHFNTDIEYFSQDFEVNDIGYLARNDMFKIENMVSYINDKSLIDYRIREYQIIFNHAYAKNNKSVVLFNKLSFKFSPQFNNYSWFSYLFDSAI